MSNNRVLLAFISAIVVQCSLFNANSANGQAPPPTPTAGYKNSTPKPVPNTPGPGNVAGTLRVDVEWSNCTGAKRVEVEAYEWTAPAMPGGPPGMTPLNKMIVVSYDNATPDGQTGDSLAGLPSGKQVFFNIRIYDAKVGGNEILNPRAASVLVTVP